MQKLILVLWHSLGFRFSHIVYFYALSGPPWAHSDIMHKHLRPYKLFDFNTKEGTKGKVKNICTLKEYSKFPTEINGAILMKFEYYIIQYMKNTIVHNRSGVWIFRGNFIGTCKWHLVATSCVTHNGFKFTNDPLKSSFSKIQLPRIFNFF